MAKYFALFVVVALCLQVSQKKIFYYKCMLKFGKRFSEVFLIDVLKFSLLTSACPKCLINLAKIEECF